MSVWELLVIAVGLSADAFAVSICKGLSVPRLRARHMLITGAYVGGFQALMPLVGYLLGYRFQSLIEQIDHWIAFALLVLIGANMIREAWQPPETLGDGFAPRAMLPLAVATSIDALAVGVSFAFLEVRIVPAVLCIGATTLLLSAAGVAIGYLSGIRYRRIAQIVGGAVLVLMGVRILLQHLGVW